MLQAIPLLIISILSTVGAQLCLKQGVLALGTLNVSLSGFFLLILRVFQNIWLTVGLFLFGISFLLWLFLLSKFQLNVVYPVTVGFNFGLITIASWFLFKEYLSPVQILGIALIMLGVFLVLPKGTI